jgi:SAM-dependent methyltransferase
MTSWDERFITGEYPRNPEPSDLLQRHLSTLPTGRALDVATGTGRNAVALATAGHRVDAVDQSREGLRIARERARERGVADRAEWIQADLDSFAFPEGAYDLVTISFYRATDRFTDIKEALAPGGTLFVEHHLRSTDPVDSGPSGDRYRFGANELLYACLDLTVLHFESRTERRDDGRAAATTRVVARKSHGTRQSYPAVDD